MELTEEDVQEFRSLYLSEFGQDISPQDARSMATRVMQLYTQIARRLPSEGTDAELAKGKGKCIVRVNGHDPSKAVKDRP